MAVIRVNKTKDYTVMSNTHLRDRRLTLKAKGLLSVMLSLPDNWDYSVEGIVAICTESKTAVQSTLKELENTGYLNRSQIQDAHGRFDYVYDIFEQPQDKKPQTENPFTDNPCTDNPPQLNTNVSNTNKPNTNTDMTPEKIQEIFDMYHDICKSLPKVKLVTDKRKSTVKARLKKYGKEQIREAFVKAERSKFLTGQVKDFKASFDWILNETNLAKIIEGNYDDKSSGYQEQYYEERDGKKYDSFGDEYL